MTRSDIEYGTGGERRQSAYVIAALVAAMVLVVALVTYFRDTTPPQIASGETCAAIADTNARLQCYDQIFDRAAGEPAKGANAPLVNR